jgi:hypothetical protein
MRGGMRLWIIWRAKMRVRVARTRSWFCPSVSRFWFWHIPTNLPSTLAPLPLGRGESSGKISAYALTDDYHIFLKEKLQNIVTFIEAEVGHPIPNRWYTDTGPILERDLAQRAGLGWIGKKHLSHPSQSWLVFLFG